MTEFLVTNGSPDGSEAPATLKAALAGGARQEQAHAKDERYRNGSRSSPSSEVGSVCRSTWKVSSAVKDHQLRVVVLARLSKQD